MTSRYQPGGALRRVTPNQGNRRYLRGGRINRKLTEQALYLGPDPAPQVWTAGVNITPILTAPLWQGVTVFGCRGLPGVVVIDRATGIISGYPSFSSPGTSGTAYLFGLDSVDGPLIAGGSFDWSVEP